MERERERKSELFIKHVRLVPIRKVRFVPSCSDLQPQLMKLIHGWQLPLVLAQGFSIPPPLLPKPSLCHIKTYIFVPTLVSHVLYELRRVVAQCPAKIFIQIRGNSIETDD